MNNEAKDILKWQGMLSEMEEVTAAVVEPPEEEKTGEVPTKEDAIKWLKDNENPSDYRVEKAARDNGWDYVSFEEVIFSLASDYAKEQK